MHEACTRNHTSARPVEACLRFILNNPITRVLFIAYAVAMISGTTYLYKDLVGWYPDLTKGYFLDNFAARGSFVDETMRRTDYRFFPLAHQELHILSWFTIHIKTWMLVSAAELIGIVLLSIQFLNHLDAGQTARQSTILLLTILFLIHPSTGTAFFHVIYCERLLCLCVHALYHRLLLLSHHQSSIVLLSHPPVGTCWHLHQRHRHYSLCHARRMSLVRRLDPQQDNRKA